MGLGFKGLNPKPYSLEFRSKMGRALVGGVL